MESSKRRDTWEAYTRSWSEKTPAERQKAFEANLHPGCVYTDPHFQVEGYRSLDGYMADFQKNIPGGHFVTTKFLTHHDRSLAYWDMLDGTGRKVGEGASFAVYDSDGRLTMMSGFFAPPEGVSA